ncbi:unnamed protein product [Allacma fusca]|uniref:SCP domain-containing protein n=1 Tax=Allacma fusca TaxID=39272 RepID=A0A8J2KQL7_9HEXA|nr:unnamed protein product [Allacma fusca]
MFKFRSVFVSLIAGGFLLQFTTSQELFESTDFESHVKFTTDFENATTQDSSSTSSAPEALFKDHPAKRGRTGRYYQESAQVATDFNWIRQSISRHNQFRYYHSAPPLRFNISLCQISQAYANRMARENLWGHNYNVLNKYGLGENLAKYTQSGSKRYVNSSVSVDLWYREIGDYDFRSGRPLYNRAVGHFTQLVWRSTYQMGTAFAIRRQGNRNVVFVVANYYPRGNVNGGYISNVLPRRRFGKSIDPEKDSWSLEQVNRENDEAIDRAKVDLERLHFEAFKDFEELTEELEISPATVSTVQKEFKSSSSTGALACTLMTIVLTGMITIIL